MIKQKNKKNFQEVKNNLKKIITDFESFVLSLHSKKIF